MGHLEQAGSVKSKHRRASQLGGFSCVLPQQLSFLIWWFNKATGNSREGGAAHLLKPEDKRQSAKARQKSIDSDHPESGNEYSLLLEGSHCHILLLSGKVRWSGEVITAGFRRNNWGHCWGIRPPRLKGILQIGLEMHVTQYIAVPKLPLQD